MDDSPTAAINENLNGVLPLLIFLRSFMRQARMPKLLIDQPPMRWFQMLPTLSKQKWLARMSCSIKYAFMFLAPIPRG